MQMSRIVPRLVGAAVFSANKFTRNAVPRAIAATSSFRFQSSDSKQDPISTEPPPEEKVGSKSNGGAESASANGASGGQPAGASSDVSKFQTEIADLKKKLKESNESRVYLLAEMENVRRIAKNDVDKAKQYAAQPISKGMLLAVDNLSMAVGSISAEKRKSDQAFDNLAGGIEATLKIFMKVLSENGTEQFGAVNDKFDPNKYEAVAMVPTTAGQAPNTVAHVMKTGFMFKDRVLRPAQVAVFMRSEAAAEAAKAAEKVATESTRSI